MPSKGKTGQKMVKVNDTLFTPKISPPEGMTEEAKVIWDELVEATPNENLLPSDFPVLESYCETIVVFRHAVQHLETQGEVLEDKNGRAYKNPWVEVMQSSNSKIANTASKLRLNPAARMDKTIVKGQRAEARQTTELGALING